MKKATKSRRRWIVASELTAAVLAELKRLEARSRDESLAPIDRVATFGALRELYMKRGPALIAAAERVDAAEKRVEELKQGCIKLSFAISQIDYAIGEPNEMGVSTYDVFPCPEDVVERVKKRVRELEERVASLRKPVQYHDVDEFYKDDTALGKEPRTTIYPPKSLCICGHCYPAPAGSLCNPEYHKQQEPRP